ncbi:MAG TPA: oxidoreductase, partial [Arthrobacter bacterium]|nr:oxidoreductase [Arthrobacter sp.]HCB57838.1 oxidoreductase [Arthrobacter sp.]HCC40029.1 oxidoreductase [Arthrobacter sp.]HCN21757.1 oxidoreductase [Arthrobacter sp.]
MTSAPITTSIPEITLNNGVRMPQLGFGVFQVSDDDTTAAVNQALEAGYRSIDTAAIYGNEAGTGRAIAESGIAREELFITSKVWVADLGYDATLAAFETSLDKLG